jgi:DNA repair protein RecO (recombination protein O)
VATVETDALVLRHVRQGDTSHVVTLLARESGRVAVMAKGSRTPGSRFGAGLDLFNLSRIRYRARPARDLVYLDACELKRDFAALARDVFAYAAAGACAELVDRLVPDGGASAEIFDELLDALSALAETAPFPDGEESRAVALAVAFQLHLMDHLGISPELTGCVACGAADLEGSTSLSPRRGGLVCRKCRAAEGGRRLGTETVEFLRQAAFGELTAALAAARPPAKGTLLEARAALDALLEYHHHGRPGAMRSRRFLDDLWR